MSADLGGMAQLTARERWIGRKFVRLTVIDYVPGKWLDGIFISHAKVTCECQCGNIAIIDTPTLLAGRQVSCGCYQRERRIKHGMSKSPEYSSWLHMKQRCLNPNSESYNNYGGRGIGICERWMHSFENFYGDMGAMPDVDYTIGRKDPNGHYGPENCEWQTRHEQSRSKRNSILIVFNGKIQCLTDWAMELGIHEETLRRRVRDWNSIEDAFTRPIS